MSISDNFLQPEMAKIIGLVLLLSCSARTNTLSCSQYENYETELSPRLILGLWHPLFIRPALKYLPTCRRFHIGFSIPVVRTFFWDVCDGFSMCFPLLMGSEGQAFLKECQEKGKEVTVWTVNDETEMRVAMSWGVKAVLTDRVGAFVNLRKKVSHLFMNIELMRQQVIEHPEKLALQGMEKYTFPWSHWRYYSVAHVTLSFAFKMFLKAHGSLASPSDTLPDRRPSLPFPAPDPDSALGDASLTETSTPINELATLSPSVSHSIFPENPL